MSKQQDASVAAVSVAPAGSAGYVKPHYDHGHSLARWVGVIISGVGFTVGCIGFPFHWWAVVYIGAGLQVVAGIVALAMNAAGYGVPDVWGRLKSEAKEERKALRSGVDVETEAVSAGMVGV